MARNVAAGVLGALILALIGLGMALLVTGTMGGLVLGALFFGGAALLALLARLVAEVVRLRQDLARRAGSSERGE